MSSLPSPRGPQLRLFSPDSAAAEPSATARGLSPQMTLSEFFEAYVLKVCLTSNEQNGIKQFRESLAYWVQFTGDPPLAMIDQYTTAAFVAVLDEAGNVVGGLRSLVVKTGRRKGEPLSANTIRKHCTEIQRLLNLAGPKVDRRQDAAALLASVPWIKKPAAVVPPVTGNYLPEEMRLVLAACRRAVFPEKLPEGLTPPVYWHNLFVFDWLTGLRIGTIWKLRFAWLVQDLFGEPLLQIPAGAMKHGARGHRLPIVPRAARAIERLRGTSPAGGPGTRELIFHCGITLSRLQTIRREILADSGLPAHRRLGFHSVRKGFATELSTIDPVSAVKAAAHAGETGKILAQHYAAEKVMRAAIDRLPDIEAGDEAEDGFLGAGI